VPLETRNVSKAFVEDVECKCSEPANTSTRYDITLYTSVSCTARPSVVGYVSVMITYRAILKRDRCDSRSLFLFIYLDPIA